MSEGLTMNGLAEKNALLVSEVYTLHQKLDAMAAENAALKQWAKEADELWVNDCDLDSHLDSVPQTPATDAYLNAVRAEGADKVAEYHFVRIDLLKEVSRQGHLFHKAAHSDAVSVANLLRAGNAGKDE